MELHCGFRSKNSAFCSTHCFTPCPGLTRPHSQAGHFCCLPTRPSGRLQVWWEQDRGLATAPDWNGLWVPLMCATFAEWSYRPGARSRAPASACTPSAGNPGHCCTEMLPALRLLALRHPRGSGPPGGRHLLLLAFPGLCAVSRGAALCCPCVAPPHPAARPLLWPQRPGRRPRPVSQGGDHS